MVLADEQASENAKIQIALSIILWQFSLVTYLFSRKIVKVQATKHIEIVNFTHLEKER